MFDTAQEAYEWERAIALLLFFLGSPILFFVIICAVYEQDWKRWRAGKDRWSRLAAEQERRGDSA